MRYNNRHGIRNKSYNFLVKVERPSYEKCSRNSSLHLVSLTSICCCTAQRKRFQIFPCISWGWHRQVWMPFQSKNRWVPLPHKEETRRRLSSIVSGAPSIMKRRVPHTRPGTTAPRALDSQTAARFTRRCRQRYKFHRSWSNNLQNLSFRN